MRHPAIRQQFVIHQQGHVVEGGPVSRLLYREELGDLKRVSRNSAILRRSLEIADPTCKGIPRASRTPPFASPTRSC